MPDSTAPTFLLRDLEALLFAAGRPLSLSELLEVLSPLHPGLTQESLESGLALLEIQYPVDGRRGFELARLAGGWVFRTNAQCEPALSALFDLPDQSRLSPAAMETLAIVAYLQPVSRRRIAEIRGVNSDSTLQTLVDRDLVVEVGRSREPGGAIQLGTTERFQIMFGLEDLGSLPSLDSLAPGEEEKESLRQRLARAAGLEAAG